MLSVLLAIRIYEFLECDAFLGKLECLNLSLPRTKENCLRKDLKTNHPDSLHYNWHKHSHEAENSIFDIVYSGAEFRAAFRADGIRPGWLFATVRSYPTRWRRPYFGRQKKEKLVNCLVSPTTS